MSDYLNNIVARSLSVADVVQPRVPHLFEQAVAASPVEMEAGSASESVAETMVGSSEEPQTSYSPTPAVLVNPTVAAPIFERFQREPVAPITPTPALPEPPMHVAEATRKPAALNTPPPRSKSLPTRAQATQSQRPVNQNASSAAETVVPSRVGPPHIDPAATVRNGEPAPHRTNASISPAALPQLNRAEPQLPPIRISIGRVDVRAVMPAGPAKAAVSTRPKPALSLESYLKQREEGKR